MALSGGHVGHRARDAVGCSTHIRVRTKLRWECGEGLGIGVREGRGGLEVWG